LLAVESFVFRDFFLAIRSFLRILICLIDLFPKSSARDQIFSENHQQPYRSFSLMNVDVDTDPDFFQNVSLPNRSFSGIVSS